MVCFVYGLLSAVGVGCIVYFNGFCGPDATYVDFLRTAFFVLLNNFDFAVLLGCPLMIASNQIISRKSGTKRFLSDNEKIILITDLIIVIALVVLISTIFRTQMTVTRFDVWNTIFILSACLINFAMAVSVIPMAIVQKNGTRK